MDLQGLLSQAVQAGASDVHLKLGQPPIVRRDGTLAPLPGWPALDLDELELVLDAVAGHDRARREAFDRTGELDLAYTPAGLPRFRVNGFRQRGSISFAMRLIPSDVPSFAGLGLPDGVASLAEEQRGLVLCTGATGSGKSTTLAAMLDLINRTRSEHILTIEDPIEFLHWHRNCVVNQREIGGDATTFAEALRAALRQDPDVILVGEMRDLETISTALTAAETGHLVFATLHTQSAPQTIDRVIDVFPAEQQDQVRVQLASTLQGVVTQTLVPTADGRGRVAALEVLIPDDAVRNLIRQGKIEQIYSGMQTGTASGMQTMEQSLASLVLRHVITREEAVNRSTRPDMLVGLVERGVSLNGLSSSSEPSLRLAEA